MRRDGASGANGALAQVLERNIAALIARRREQERAQRWSERLSDRITAFVGSMTFVVIHVVVTAFWILANVGLLPGVPRFDADFVKLATAASVEAIFITTFVLVTQNRMAAAADERADLDLQISLLAEHEITRHVRLVARSRSGWASRSRGAPTSRSSSATSSPRRCWTASSA